jgi:soluble lytic murein transglycosylase-like protein
MIWGDTLDREFGWELTITKGRIMRRIIGAAAIFVALLPGVVSAQGGGSYEQAIYDACARYGCSAEHVIATMYCESGGDPGAVNPVTGDYGLMQINLSIWGPITDPYAQIEFAAQKFAAGQSYLWLCA